MPGLRAGPDVDGRLAVDIRLRRIREGLLGSADRRPAQRGPARHGRVNRGIAVMDIEALI